MTPQALLQSVYGYSSFRQGQEEIVNGILAGRDSVCIMPTGAGKSVCYQIPALLLPGITLVISPLISLMKDQVAALKQRGISAECLHSAMEEDVFSDTVYRVATGGCKLVYIAPERLQNNAFLRMCEHIDISLVAVDEAHCISQWGQDFRPSYLHIVSFIRSLRSRPVVGAFTATATRQVKEDILHLLDLVDPVSVTTGFDRPNLSFSVFEPKNKDAALLTVLRERFHQSGIVYCSTRKTVEAVSGMLQEEGYAATRYHAGLSPAERVRNQEDFLFDRKTVMVATNAFGMGIDKSNVSFVVHYNMPQSLEAYYQEAGRAGRDGCDADCILLYSAQDVHTARWLIEHSDPNPDLSPQEQQDVLEKDLLRLKKMTFYAKSKRCLRADILHYFGENAPDRCNNCSNCNPDCGSVDITVDAQKILSCIVRTGESLDCDALVSILRGTLMPTALPEIDPERLTTWGIMQDCTPDEIKREITALLKQGYLRLQDTSSGVLLLTDSASGVLFRGKRVTMKLSEERAASASRVNEELLQKLKYLRLQLASKEQVAAFVLFSDATLIEICKKLPSSFAELEDVSGVGTYKANRYGYEILQMVRPFLPSHPRQRIRQKKNRSLSREKTEKTLQSYKDRIYSEGKTEAYASWGPKEDAELEEEFLSGLSLQSIAANHKRTTGAIRSRLKKLHITDDA